MQAGPLRKQENPPSEDAWPMSRHVLYPPRETPLKVISQNYYPHPRRRLALPRGFSYEEHHWLLLERRELLAHGLGLDDIFFFFIGCECLFLNGQCQGNVIAAAVHLGLPPTSSNLIPYPDSLLSSLLALGTSEP